MSVCAVRVNDVVGVGGFVVPGMRVDVLISGNTPGPRSADGPKVKTLLQNIEVLSAGTNFQKDAEGKPIQVPVVNLLVTLEQAEVLSLDQTTIQLILRNYTDPHLPRNAPRLGPQKQRYRNDFMPIRDFSPIRSAGVTRFTRVGMD